MKPDLQSRLENTAAILFPLQATDFDELYAVASDPKIWEQHPNKDRWKKEVFTTFFEGALQSGGAFKVVEKATGNVVGCTRFYDFNDTESSIHIGYTFYGTRYWGTGINHSVKKLMLDYIFKFVTIVYFHIGAVNIRSQVSLSRLGARKVKELEVAYFGEAPKLNYVYCLTRDEWVAQHHNSSEV